MIRIGQTLHGYDNGHSLLASSNELPYEAESTLFVLSDLSGQTFVAGFEQYVTGYPISETHSYAIARTWYAPEMDRPGCVWTHTLIISFGDLARMNSLAPLLNLFVRPGRSSKSWKHYEDPLSVEQSRFAVPSNAEALGRDLFSQMGLCNALYGTPTSPVIVPVLESSVMERDIFALWSQQWPRLRRNFAFCSGSIDSREVNGRPFDLQCIPLDYSSLGSTLPSNAVLVNSPLPNRLPEHTLIVIADDLGRPNESLRSFMRNYGADAPGDRASFAAMVQVWEKLNEGIAAQDAFVQCARLVARLFPAPQSIAKLRRDLVIESQIGNIRISLPVEDRLIALMAMNFHDEPLALIEVSSLMQHIVDTDPAAFIRFLDRLIRLHRLSDAATPLLSLAVSRIDVTIIEQNASEQLLLVLVSIHPQLLGNPKVCQTLFHRGHELVDIFASRRSSIHEWRELLQAIITNDLQQTASLSFTKAPMDLVKEVLQIFETIDTYRESFGAWFTEIERRQPSAVAWLRSRESLGVANRLGLSLVLDPVYCSHSEVSAILFLGIEEDASERRLTFAFVLSGNDRGADAARIFATAFRKLHQIVTVGNVEYFSWRILQQVLPELSFFANWDTAERLRRYYADKYAFSGWPYGPFWDGLEGQEVTWRVLEYMASEKPLHAFGRSLLRGSSNLSLPRWQLDIINNAPRKLRH